MFHGMRKQSRLGSADDDDENPWLPDATDSRRGSSASTTTSITTSIRGACKVPICKNPNCSLKSHRLYNPSINYIQREALKQKRSLSALRNEPFDPGVDALPRLPIEGDDNVIRPLFHHFFEVVFDRLAALFRGPSVVTSDHKKRMLPVALSNSTYCMGLVLQSHTDIIGRTRNFAESRKSVYLYAKLIKAFQREIQNLPQHIFAIELALLDICILLAYDMFYDRRQFIWHHWQGMQRLVEFAGGIEAISTALPYVIHVDRTVAVIFSQRPAFSRSREIVVEPPPTSSRHASSFVGLSDTVLDYCRETARLLDLWEDVHQSAASGPVYLHNFRDRIDERFTLMHAEMMSMPLTDQCCFIAARIVEYPITWANYYPLNNHKQCVQLCQLLQSAAIDWQRDLLRWMLFAVLVAPARVFSGRTWALSKLKISIEKEYGPDVWARSGHASETVLASLRGFIWHDSALNSLFKRVWADLGT